MNAKLVNSLIQVIDSLSAAERELLHQRLNQKQVWQAARQRLYTIHAQVRHGQGGKTMALPAADIIWQGRQQRDKQVLEAVFPDSTAL
ncbi:MAG: hypothetical protein ACFCVB_12700 [Nodosilinea sp.]